MTRELLCERCTYTFLARVGHKAWGDLPSDPGWQYRLIFGQARQPTQAQRTITVNDVPFPKTTDAYECDLCDAKVVPGANAVCRTMYRNGEDVPDWEHEYLNPPTNWKVPHA